MAAIDIDSSRMKIIAFSSVSVLSAVIFSYYFRRLFSGFGTGDLLNVGIILIFWMAIFILSSLLVKSLNIGFGIIFLEVFAVWIFLPGKFSLFPILAVAALFGGLALGFLRGRTEVQNSLEIKFLKASRRASNLALTGIALFVTLILLGTFGFREFNVSKRAFEVVLKAAEPIVVQFIPGFSLAAPFNETLKNFVRSRVQQGTQEAAINETASNLRADIVKSTGTTLEPGDTTIDALYKIFTFKLLTLPLDLKNFVFLTAGILIFFLMKGVNFFLNLIINAVAFLLYQLLIAFNFMHIASENRTKEVLIVD